MRCKPPALRMSPALGKDCTYLPGWKSSNAPDQIEELSFGQEGSEREVGFSKQFYQLCALTAER
jgi:hypothetical protein